MGGRLENLGREKSRCAAVTAERREPKPLPFSERLSCTIDEACEARGAGFYR
jgi:hypothetical protein